MGSEEMSSRKNKYENFSVKCANYMTKHFNCLRFIHTEKKATTNKPSHKEMEIITIYTNKNGAAKINNLVLV